MREQSVRHWTAGFDDGSFLHEWRGFAPFWLGCFYGESKCNGGEEKYSHCYDFCSGIGDVEWWIADEIAKLSVAEQEEMYQLMVRNKAIDDKITYDAINMIASVLGVEKHHIYRLGNRHIIKLVECKTESIEDEYKRAIKGVGLNTVATEYDPFYKFICEKYTDLEEHEYTNKFVISYISGHRVVEIKVRERIHKLVTEHFSEDVVEVSELLEFICKIAE